MCNIKKFFTRAAGIPDPGYISAADAAKGLDTATTLKKATDSANAALLAQQQSIDQAKAASDSASETDALSREAQLRKLAAAGSFGASFKGNFQAPNVAYRQLFGAS